LGKNFAAKPNSHILHITPTIFKQSVPNYSIRIYQTKFIAGLKRVLMSFFFILYAGADQDSQVWIVPTWAWEYLPKLSPRIYYPPLYPLFVVCICKCARVAIVRHRRIITFMESLSRAPETHGTVL